VFLETDCVLVLEAESHGQQHIQYEKLEAYLQQWRSQLLLVGHLKNLVVHEQQRNQLTLLQEFSSTLNMKDTAV
jgi:hypothetical protein